MSTTHALLAFAALESFPQVNNAAMQATGNHALILYLGKEGGMLSAHLVQLKGDGTVDTLTTFDHDQEPTEYPCYWEGKSLSEVIEKVGTCEMGAAQVVVIYFDQNAAATLSLTEGGDNS